MDLMFTDLTVEKLREGLRGFRLLGSSHDFIDEYGFNLTQAGTAMKQWRAMSIGEVPKTDAAFYDAFYPYYAGGRVQCFQKGVIEQDGDLVGIEAVTGLSGLL